MSGDPGPCQTLSAVRKYLRGDLATFSLPDLLQWLEFGRQSGRVTLTHGPVLRTVDVKDGEIVFVSSTSAQERLAVHLVRTGVLSSPTAYAGLAENLLSGKNLTRVILDRGLASRERLARAVEELAVKILLDSFRWRGATFEFDPEVPTEDILRIHLSLRGQILALQGAKTVDESDGRGPGAAEEGWEPPAGEEALSPESVADTFWAILDRIPPADGSAAALSELFFEFRRFVAELRRRTTGPLRFAPLFDDTAVLVRRALAQGSADHQLIQISALDPFLTLNLISFANLLPPPGGPVGTVGAAAETVGSEALRLFLDLSSASDAPRTPSDRPLEQAVRTTSISTAVASARVARRLGRDEDEAYAAGLLSPLGVHELLQALLTVGLRPGAFRAGALGEYRSLCGALLARRWGLPDGLAALLETDGNVTEESAEPAKLVFLAGQLVPLEGIGYELATEEPGLVSQAASLASDAALIEEIRRDTDQLLEIIDLR